MTQLRSVEGRNVEGTPEKGQVAKVYRGPNEGPSGKVIRVTGLQLSIEGSP